MRVEPLLPLFFVLVPRTDATIKLALFNGGSEFFDPVEEGFHNRCKALGIECNSTRITGAQSTEECVEMRRERINEWVKMGVIGVAVKPCSWSDGMEDIYIENLARGVYITTFDSDSENVSSARAAYVGTDNLFMGRTLAKLLRQLKPEGGTFAIIANKEHRTEGFIEEITRFNHREDMSHWYEAKGPTDDYLWALPRSEAYLDNKDNLTDKYKNPVGSYIPVMERAASLNVTAMIFMKQTPMRHPNYTDFIDRHRHRGITYIGTDGADYQLAYLNSRYVDGLVGQLPYEMGTESAQVLYDIITNNGSVAKKIVATNIVAYNLIPLQLPALDVDDNTINGLRIVGYICFGIASLSVLLCFLWTWKHRNSLVVRAAQPVFLYIVAVGILIMEGSLIPLTFDDGGEMNSISRTKAIGICMSIPWLGFCGFTVTFSALFSKLWRVNHLFRASTTNTKIKITEIDVIGPFVVLLSSNILVLTLWTIYDPLTYVRIENTGTDYWNRIISTYGSCTSANIFAYIVPLALINFVVVIIASWQSYLAKDIKLEFSEAKYIGLATGGLLQAFLTGIPVIAVVRDEPQAFYLILTMLIFGLGESILLLIFLPKIFLHRQYMRMDEGQQKRLFGQRIRDAHSGSRVGGRAASGSSSHQTNGSTDPKEFPSRYRHASGSRSSNQTAISDRLASVDEEGHDDGDECRPYVSETDPIDPLSFSLPRAFSYAASHLEEVVEENSCASARGSDDLSQECCEPTGERDTTSTTWVCEREIGEQTSMGRSPNEASGETHAVGGAAANGVNRGGVGEGNTASDGESESLSEEPAHP